MYFTSSNLNHTLKCNNNKKRPCRDCKEVSKAACEHLWVPSFLLSSCRAIIKQILALIDPVSLWIHRSENESRWLQHSSKDIVLICYAYLQCIALTDQQEKYPSWGTTGMGYPGDWAGAWKGQSFRKGGRSAGMWCRKCHPLKWPSSPREVISVVWKLVIMPRELQASPVVDRYSNN